MGLDFSHSTAHWSYGGFNRFRSRLVEKLGCDWIKMVGDRFSDKKPDDAENEKFAALNDAIEPLIFHSDCDGELTPEQCAKVAPRLKELVSDWPDDDYDKTQALLLADSMLECAESGEALEFC